MTICRCSQCDPQGCARILCLLPLTKAEDFINLMQSYPTQPEDVSRFSMPKQTMKRKFSARIPLLCKDNDPIRLSVPMIELAVMLVGRFEKLFDRTYPSGSHMIPSMLFDREEAWQIVKNYDSVRNGVFLREILGGETLAGQFALVNECIQVWMLSPVYNQYQEDLENEQVRLDQEILDLDLIEADHQEQMRLNQIKSNIKKAEIAERKRIRLQIAIDKRIQKELKTKHQNNNVARDVGHGFGEF